MWELGQVGEPDSQVHLTREDWVYLSLHRSHKEGTEW